MFTPQQGILEACKVQRSQASREVRGGRGRSSGMYVRARDYTGVGLRLSSLVWALAHLICCSSHFFISVRFSVHDGVCDCVNVYRGTQWAAFGESIVY